MDWRSVKFDWNRARAFLVTAEEGSLSAAARALGLAQPTLGRQVDALQQELGVVLFERMGRGLRLTPSGMELLAHVRAMGDAANRVSRVAAGQSASVEGHVCLAASEVYAAYLLPPIIEKIRRLAPGIDIEVVTSSAPSDLSRREADIAIRNFRPTDPELFAKKIRDVPAGLFASPRYLQQIDHPKTLAEFSAADFISIDDSGKLLEWLNASGLSLTERSFPIYTKNYLVMWEMVKQGLGIGILDAEIGAAEPQVQEVLTQLKPTLFPIWLVAHREVNTSHRIRLVFDILAEALARPFTPRAG